MDFPFIFLLVARATTLPFQTVWRVATNHQLVLPISQFEAGFTVNWGDGTDNEVPTGVPISHTYLASGNFTVNITGPLYYFSMESQHDVRVTLLEVKSWGELVIDNKVTNVFRGCSNLVVSARDQPIISEGTVGLVGMFDNCPNVNSALTWDINGAISLVNMFRGAALFNSPLKFTNTGHVRALSGMFAESGFNQDLALDTSSVNRMGRMFQNAFKFNGLLTFSNTSNVIGMDYLFLGAKSYNRPVNFDTRSVMFFQGMFYGASQFNQPINFNTESATDMSQMFAKASKFNSAVTFSDTSKLTNASEMFMMTSFNQPVTFSLTSVTHANNMFDGIRQFHQDLSALSMSNVIECLDFCFYCYLPTALFTRCNPCSLGTLQTVDGKKLCFCRYHDKPSSGTCVSPTASPTASPNESLTASPTAAPTASAFVTVWKTTSPYETVTLPWTAVSSMDVVWGDGNAPETNAKSHVYTIAGTHTITIVGAVYGSFWYGGDRNKIYDVQDWGGFTIDTNSFGMFNGCENLQVSARDEPTFLPKATLAHMFANCPLFNTQLVWNTINVVNMRSMFRNATLFNQSVDFVTDNVTDMSYMFDSAKAFNSAVTFSSTARVLTMERMFSECHAFNQPLNFSTGNVENMNEMFTNSPFEQDVGTWDVSKVVTCHEFCSMCGLPKFDFCGNLCALKTTSRGWTVCNCPKGEVFMSATECLSDRLVF